MKKGEQSRRENSAAPVNTQTQNSTPGAVPDVEENKRRIESALREIDCELAENHPDTDVRGLRIIRGILSGPVNESKTEPPAPPAPPLPIIATDPYPTHEDPRDVAGPLFHVRDSYEAALKKEHEDAFSSLINLWQCIEHHPGLRAETAALQLLTEGWNVLCKLSNDHSSATECSNDLTGAEVWLANLLHKMDKGVSIESFILKLLNAPERLRKNPKTVALAGVIEGMFEGKHLLWKMSMWLDSL